MSTSNAFSRLRSRMASSKSAGQAITKPVCIVCLFVAHFAAGLNKSLLMQYAELFNSPDPKCAIVSKVRSLYIRAAIFRRLQASFARSLTALFRPNPGVYAAAPVEYKTRYKFGPGQGAGTAAEAISFLHKLLIDSKLPRFSLSQLFFFHALCAATYRFVAT